jgi:NAD-dependent SIR2 family protein deacetylase
MIHVKAKERSISHLTHTRRAQLYFPGGTDPPVKVVPSDTHKLLALLDQKKMLLRIYSQNIDGTVLTCCHLFGNDNNGRFLLSYSLFHPIQYNTMKTGLEETAGVTPQRIAYVHGSLKFATCEMCRRKVAARMFEEDILAGRVARCKVPRSSKVVTTTTTTTSTPRTRTSARKRARGPVDNDNDNDISVNVCGGVLKPGVTFFGEALQDSIKTKLEADREKVDALIVIGTSLSVYVFFVFVLIGSTDYRTYFSLSHSHVYAFQRDSAPISKVINYLPKSIPRFLINRNITHPPPALSGASARSNGEEEEDFRDNYVFDAYLLGNCDDVMRALGKSLLDLHLDTDEFPSAILSDTTAADEVLLDRWSAVTVPKHRVFLFPGAEPPPPPLSLPLRKRITTEPIARKSTSISARCDNCAVDIQGVIQTCGVCFDYDLCRDCYPIVAATHFDGTHQFQTEIVDPD